MFFRPFALGLLLFLSALLAILVVLVELRVLEHAYRKIGIRPRHVFLLMMLSLLGSHVNVPLWSVPVERLEPPREMEVLGRIYIVPPTRQEGTTVVAVNVGGALIPVLVSVHLALRTKLFLPMGMGSVVVAAVVHQMARVVPGVGVVVPMLAPPLAAAAAALLFAPRRAPPVAYVSGSVGALLGADILNLVRVEELGAPLIAIGGAGTFDGVFLTGILAGLLV